MIRRSRAAALVATLAAVSAVAAPDTPADAARKEIVKAAAALARAGRRAETDEALRHLRDLGEDAAALAKVRASCDALAAKAGKRAPSVPDAAKALRAAAASLATGLAAAADGEREPLARRILSLDGREPAAHAALGHVQHEGRWLPPEVPACLARRREIVEAVRAAHRLSVEVEREESWLGPVLEVARRGQARAARAGSVSVHSADLPVDKMERILRQSLRALALSEFLCGEALEVPAFQRDVRFILCGNRPRYLAALAEAAANGGVGDEDVARYREMGGYIDRRGFYVFDAHVESDAEASLFLDLRTLRNLERLRDGGQPALEAGHVNWVLLTFVGRGIPRIAWTEETGGDRPRGATSDRHEAQERQTLFRLAKRGVSGARAWLAWLARRGEAPAWSRSMVDAIGKIQGSDLTKCTFVAEYLHELARFDEIARESLEPGTVAKAVETAFGCGLPEFERRWLDWFLPEEPGLAERVEAAPEEVSPADRKLLGYLDRLRLAAVWARDREIVAPLELASDLSDGCRLHARYLVRHPDQLARWPDAHEEYPDREGFTAEGCRAGLSSVIAPGVATAEEAVDGWMGTFYHRLPLLDPGLLRIGFGMEGGIAVLDSGSMVADSPIGTYCVWPPPGAKDVPRRFNPELPNPVPGEDQSKWGYPVTLQLFSWDEPQSPRLSMTLGGKPVDCWLATPDEPTNPEIAPAGAWCLMPKQTLAPNATYTVTADGVPQVGRLEWTFTTGR